MDIELLKIFYDEWKFRQENLWKKMYGFFVVIFFATTLPITGRVFNGLKLPDISLYIYPGSGILLTAYYIWYCLAESVRIKAVEIKIDDLVKSQFGEKYARVDLPCLRGNCEKKSTIAILRWRMSIWVPVALSIFLVLVSGAVITLIAMKLI